MTSRAGSLIVAVFLGGVSLLAVILIIVLTNGDGEADGSALIQVSLREGDIVLLGEPLEILVVARDDEPVTEFSLAVDGVLVTRAVPDPVGGTYSKAMSWIPDRLGMVSVAVTALSLDGSETEQVIRVEVTDNPELVRASPRVTIVSPPPLQRIAVDRGVNVLVQAQSSDPISRFELEVSGVVADTVEAEPGQSEGDVVTLRYTPTSEGIVVLRVRAVTAAGTAGVAEVTVEVVPEDEAAETEATDLEAVSGEDGVLRIVSPANGAEFDFDPGISIDVEIEATATGALQVVELYVNTILQQSVRPDARADGSYVLSIPFSPGTPGSYAVEVVAISERSLRFDSRIDLVVLSAEGEETPPDGEEEPADGEPPADGEEPAPEPAALPDLVPVEVQVGEGNAVVVSVRNAGQEPMGPAPVLITVVRTADGLLIGEEPVTLALGPGESRLVPLELGLTDSIDITVIVDTANVVQEADEDNNTIATVFQPLSRPDLVARNLELDAAGRPLVSLVNAGSAVASGPIQVLILFNGQALERLMVPGDLAVQGTLQLGGSVAAQGEGQLSAIVDPDNVIAESNEANNSVTITVAANP